MCSKRLFIVGTVLLMGIITVCAQQIVQVLEAESAELRGQAKVKYVSGYSGNAYVGDNNPGSSITFRNVTVPTEGAYEFRTFYTSMNLRSVGIRSNTNPKVVCTCPTETLDWNTPPVAWMTTYIYLNQGVNTVVIAPEEGGGPNIDKFEVRTTSVAMPRPQPVNVALGYDLTDEALVTTNRTADNLTAATDNAIGTTYLFAGTSVELKVELPMPHLLTGFLLSAGMESSQNVSNWKLELSADGVTYYSVTPNRDEQLDGAVLFHVNRYPHGDVNKSVRYYRLTAQGGSVAEFQLFGIPYLSNSDKRNFPADLTEGTDLRSAGWGDPLGVYQYGSFDERYYNLFDRNMERKYYWGSASSFVVEMELPAATPLYSYTLTSCQDYPERDPRTWVVEGYDRRWELVSEVTDFAFPTRYATMKFYSHNPKAYKGYRLRLLTSNGANAFQLLKWQLFGGLTKAPSDATATEALPVVGLKGALRIIGYGGCAYAVYDLHGRVVRNGQLNSGADSEVTLDKGLYIVKVSRAEGDVTTKVIVR